MAMTPDKSILVHRRVTLESYVAANEGTWKEMVAAYGLRDYTLDDLLGQSAQCVYVQMNNCPPPHRLGGPKGHPWLSQRSSRGRLGFRNVLIRRSRRFIISKRWNHQRILPKPDEIRPKVANGV